MLAKKKIYSFRCRKCSNYKVAVRKVGRLNMCCVVFYLIIRVN